MNVSLSRLLVFAEQDQAEQLVRLLTAITGAEPPTWTNHRRRDGSYTHGSTVSIGDITVDVRIGRPAAPALLELETDQPLEQVLDQVVGVLGAATSWPNDPDAPLESVTAHVGEALTVRFAPTSVPTDHDVTAEATGSSISVRFTSAPDAAGLQIPRCVYLNSGADLAEQVEQLLRDQPSSLRAQVLAAATEAVTA